MFHGLDVSYIGVKLLQTFIIFVGQFILILSPNMNCDKPLFDTIQFDSGGSMLCTMFLGFEGQESDIFRKRSDFVFRYLPPTIAGVVEYKLWQTWEYPCYTAISRYSNDLHFSLSLHLVDPAMIFPKMASFLSQVINMVNW